MTRTTASIPDLDALPIICDVIQLPAVIPPDFDGDGRFGLSSFGANNSRELARCNGRWYVRWPGFAWCKADKDYM